MKSKSLIIILLLSITFFAEGSASEIRWGLKGGLNFSYFNSEIGPWKDARALSVTGNTEPFFISPRVGLSGGVIMNYKMGDVFGLYSELLYSPKGSTYERESMEVMEVSELGGSRPVKETIKYALDYIELPMGVLIQPHKRFTIKLGIVPAVNVSSRIKFNYWDEDENSNDLWYGYPVNNIPGTPVKEEYDNVKFDYANRLICSTTVEINYNTRKGYYFLNYSRTIGDVYNMEELNGYNMETQNTVFSIGYAFLIPD